MTTHFSHARKPVQTACGRYSGDPSQWPTTELWADIWSFVTCPECLATKDSTDLSTVPTGYDDTTPMPFGKHRGIPLSDVPASYLHWLWTQRPIRDKLLEDYIRRNISALRQEHPDGIWT